MNNFVVPQFIDVEAKILGPITMRQFVITLVGGFGVVILYKIFGMSLSFILLAFLIVVVMVLFGFYKVNGRPFHMFLVSVLESATKPSVRVWVPFVDNVQMSGKADFDLHQAKRETTEEMIKKINSKSRLKELTLIVDTGGIYKESPTFRVRSNIMNNYARKI